MNGSMDIRQLLNDRFAISLILALALHAVVLLGISFVLDINPLKKAADSLDVVLVNWRSETPPDEAEFLAPAAQQGGGESEEAEKPASELSPEVPSLDQGHMPVSSPEVLPKPAEDRRETLVEERSTERPVQQITQVEQPDPDLPSAAELMQQSMQAARLQPDRQRETRWQSKLPRRKFISANTREYEYATYMQAWVAKVERVGNLNYPVELKRRRIAGSLLMTVGINQDGSVESIKILEGGSGISEIDRAARRIVHLAAPYAPLPADIRRNVDVLHITRTWRFSNGNRFE